jgi:hypothetical protein
MSDWKLLAVCTVALVVAYASDPQSIPTAHGASHSAEASLGLEPGQGGPVRLSLASFVDSSPLDDPEWIEQRLQAEECCSPE